MESKGLQEKIMLLLGKRIRENCIINGGLNSAPFRVIEMHNIYPWIFLNGVSASFQRSDPQG